MVADYWELDTQSKTMQNMETIVIFKMSSEVIKFPTIGAASLVKAPTYNAHHLPIWGRGA